MAGKFNILVLGASYGSLLGIKLGLAGHHTHLVCLPAEADLINSEGAIVRMPVKGRDGLVEVELEDAAGQAHRRRTAGRRSGEVRPGGAGDAGAAVPLARRARAARRRRQGQGAVHVDHEHAAAALSGAHPRRRRRSAAAAPTPTRRSGTASIRRTMTLCSPDPQAFRPPEDKVERAAGAPADQLQGGALRLRRAHRDPAPARRRHRGGALRGRRRDASSCR